MVLTEGSPSKTECVFFPPPGFLICAYPLFRTTTTTMTYDMHSMTNKITSSLQTIDTTKGKRERGADRMLQQHSTSGTLRNLRLLFANVPEVTINDCGSLKDWIKEASHEQYWNKLVDCLTDRQAVIPTRPDNWPRPRRSPRNHDAPPQHQQPFPPTPPCTRRTNHATTPEPRGRRRHQNLPPPSPPHCPSPPRRQRPAPPPPQATEGRDYIPEQLGHCVYDSLKILGLGLGASEREVKLAYQRLASIFHPDKWVQQNNITGMTYQETTAHFQLLNSAQAFLRSSL